MAKATDIILVIDLDKSLWVTTKDAAKIDRRHILSKLMPVKLVDKKVYITAIINLYEMSDLIEYACTNFGGIIIETNGNWGEKSVKKSLIRRLKVNLRTQIAIKSCPFLSPDTVAYLFPGVSSEHLKKVYKSDWVEKYFEYTGQKNKRLVVVDDDNDQLCGFLANKHTFALIQATTRSKDIYKGVNALQFYKEAKAAMDQAKATVQRFSFFTSRWFPCKRPPKDEKLQLTPVLIYPRQIQAFFQTRLDEQGEQKMGFTMHSLISTRV